MKRLLVVFETSSDTLKLMRKLHEPEDEKTKIIYSTDYPEIVKRLEDRINR